MSPDAKPSSRLRGFVVLSVSSLPESRRAATHLSIPIPSPLMDSDAVNVELCPG